MRVDCDQDALWLRVEQAGPGACHTGRVSCFYRTVRLKDGDWTVNVTMPSGRVYPVSRIRVSNGQIMDPQGNRIPSLEITR